MQQGTTRVNPSEETIKIGPLGIRFLLTGDDSNGSVSVFEVLVPVGQKLAAPAHKNDAYEEILYGIGGVLTWTVDGTPIEVGPGQALCIPRGAVHRFDNLGSEDVKQLAVVTPAIMGPAYFREAAAMPRCIVQTPGAVSPALERQSGAWGKRLLHERANNANTARRPLQGVAPRCARSPWAHRSGKKGPHLWRPVLCENNCWS
jgi:quercetin dioxygenase-like cupin family protein